MSSASLSSSTIYAAYKITLCSYFSGIVHKEKKKFNNLQFFVLTEEPTSSQQTPEDSSAGVGSTNTETGASSAPNENEGTATSTQSEATPGSSSQEQNDQNQQPRRPV